MADDENLGGGSGGDAATDGKGHQVISADGTYEVRGNQIALVSWKNLPPATDADSRIMLLAMGGLTGAFMDDGTVDVR